VILELDEFSFEEFADKWGLVDGILFEVVLLILLELPLKDF
jgi:hypothetical protein